MNVGLPSFSGSAEGNSLSSSVFLISVSFWVGRYHLTVADDTYREKERDSYRNESVSIWLLHDTQVSIRCLSLEEFLLRSLRILSPLPILCFFITLLYSNSAFQLPSTGWLITLWIFNFKFLSWSSAKVRCHYRSGFRPLETQHQDPKARSYKHEGYSFIEKPFTYSPCQASNLNKTAKCAKH